MSQNVTVTSRQERTIVRLLSESSIEAAARAVGISPRTLWRWLNDPVFAEAYRQARREAVNHAISRLQQVASEAVDTLQAVITAPEVPAPARVSAAKAVLDFAIKGVELEDLECRIKRLEELSHGN